ncbi:virulence associated lipoprotein [Borrelia duttonii]|uniref:virulence associated lipoprotein n=1 Tax=Borrelia duttonii TaxID=40834 RepID=UPI0004B734ED|nr:virulence associated lipoprotein [Borrelia duttonii]
MKQKVFIIFILISLISLLLIACGQNGKKPVVKKPVVDPVDNAEVPLETLVAPAEVPLKTPDAPAEVPLKTPDAPAEVPLKTPDAPAEVPLKTPDAPAEVPLKTPDAPAEVPLKTPDAPVDNTDVQLKLKQEEEEKQRRIEDIKKNGISSEVMEILKEYRKGPSKLQGLYGNYVTSTYYLFAFIDINRVFEKVPYKNGNEVVYGDITDKTTTADAAARKAAREEVLLAFGYSHGFARVVGESTRKLVKTSELLIKNKVKVKDFLIKIRKCAKAYYIDVYDTLEKKLGNLESLSAAEVKSLHDNLALLKAERDKLVSKILQPFKDKYPMIREFWDNPASDKGWVTVTADELLKYWNTLSAEFDSICNEIMMISGEIKGILDRFEVKG